MSGRIEFLVISSSREHHWYETLRKTLAPVGTLRIETEEEAVKLVMSVGYDLVIVDATVVDNVPLLLARIRAQRPSAYVVVATANPSWDKARQAFQAGASDYVSKSFDATEILAVVSAEIKRRGLDVSHKPFRR
ncbi:MAG TPA: response regulator [Blastocatellia bacterium]|nr:response regulator [Blastocatellia bacterium]